MYILFFFVWVIFNGKITLEITLFGLVIAAALFWFACKFLDYSVDKEIKFWKTCGHIIGYIGTLIVEIIKANFATMKFILTESEEIDPVVVEFDSDLKTNTAKSLLADSITLTPGTITVAMEKNHYMVHCLDESLAEGIDESSFVTKLKNMDDIWTENKNQEKNKK